MLEVKQGDWNAQQDWIKEISMHFIITCIKIFIWKHYKKLYNERIFLDLHKKTSEVGTKKCSKNVYFRDSLDLVEFYPKRFCV